jgi:hypothetical protein
VGTGGPGVRGIISPGAKRSRPPADAARIFGCAGRKQVGGKYVGSYIHSLAPGVAGHGL